LARQGHRVTVYERFETPRPIGSGLMLQPPGLAALERLGLRVELEALGERIERLHGATVNGRTIFQLNYTSLIPDLHAVAVHRAALHGVLWRAFEQSGAQLETGQTITGVGPPLDNANLVVDASGARSPLRSWVCARKVRVFPYGAVWASVPDIGVAPAALAQRYVAARIMIGYLPVGRITPKGPRMAALFWSMKPADYSAWRAGFPAWRDQVTALWPELAPLVDTLTDPDALTLADYAHFTADMLWRDNVVLIGDAAHATSPQLGQGANHGLIDAVVLADALAQSDALPDALALYARARRQHVRFYQLASAVMTPFFQSDSRVLAMVRDLTFHRARIVPYLHREMLRTLAGLKTGLFRAGTPGSIVNCVS
jgi:2-polyprenyl-6-methoxyphenol hydroxylase-like FAD-dependent oxidoreductase